MEKDLRIAGCYKITNTTNGKIYIGESNNILNRWRRHIKDLLKVVQFDFSFITYKGFFKMYNFIKGKIKII